MSGVVLEAPGDFQEMKVNLGSANEAIEKADAHTLASPAVEIQVIRILYKESRSVSKTACGAPSRALLTPGLRNLTHKRLPALSRAKPAMRMSIAADLARGRVRLEGETILDGEILYQIQALYEARDWHASQNAGKILDSVRSRR